MENILVKPVLLVKVGHFYCKNYQSLKLDISATQSALDNSPVFIRAVSHAAACPHPSMLPSGGTSPAHMHEV